MLSHKKTSEPLSISFGSGGGFTGAVDEYILSEKGQLKKVSGLNHDTLILKTISRSEVKPFFDAIKSPEFKKIQLNETGNMTWFIHYYKGSKLIRTYRWVETTMRPDNLIKFYNSLMEHTLLP